MSNAEHIAFLEHAVAALIALLGLSLAICFGLVVEMRRARSIAMLANPQWNPADDDRLMPGTRWLVERMRKAGAL